MSISRDEPDPIATVVDWLDACRSRRIHALLDLYDEAATLECACDGTNSLTGRAALEAYWRPKLANALPGPLPWMTCRPKRWRDPGLPEF